MKRQQACEMGRQGSSVSCYHVKKKKKRFEQINRAVRFDDRLSRPGRYRGGKAVVSYIPKQRKKVVLLSTRHRELQVQDSGKRKPHIILDYNKCKGTVDHLDQVSTIISNLFAKLFTVSHCYN